MRASTGKPARSTSCSSLGYLDPFFIRLEAALFGTQPSLAFMDWAPYLPVSELAYASYFSYYVMIAGVGLALYVRDRRHFFHYISVISFVFYVCYLDLHLRARRRPAHLRRTGAGVPAPPVAHALPTTFPPAITVGPFFQIMRWIYQMFEAPGAAFPSSHVAIALATVYFSFRYLRRIRWVHLAVAVLLCTATVYCRYHYVVDVVAGALTAGLLIPLANRLYVRFGEAAPPAAAPPGAGAARRQTSRS